MLIRPFQDTDAEPLSQIIQACFEAMPTGTDPPEFIALQIYLYDREHILQDVREMHLFVVMEDDMLIGSGGYSAKKIHALYIAPAYQQRGTGSQVLEFLLTQARAENIRTIKTWSTRVAEHFYQKHGFQKLGHISFPNLGFMNVFVEMEKRLDD
jgi:GNAT superfamily N-acetyltransferase